MKELFESVLYFLSMFASYKTKILPFYNTSVDLLLLFMWHLVFEHEDYVKFEVEHVGRQPYKGGSQANGEFLSFIF